jgi:hypothetical protein
MASLFAAWGRVAPRAVRPQLGDFLFRRADME